MNETITKQESLSLSKVVGHGKNQKYPFSKEEEETEPRDRLIYYPSNILETIRNAAILAPPLTKDYAPLKQYEHLRNVHINLVQARLTDKQMIAVSLVFYGQLKKNHAARIMKIAKQSLDSHLKLAMRKIERCLSL